MKKTVSLLLAAAMCLALAACSGSNDAKIKDLTEVYNQVAVPYNEAFTKAQENGWMEDEQTVVELNALTVTLDPIGQALSGDKSALDGADLDAMIEQLQQLVDPVEELVQRVSVPYEG